MTAIAESAPDVATGPQERVDAWLAKFEAALAARDVAAAADLFEPGGFWRDLVSFTWNLHTSEGRDQIAAMLSERLDDTAPSGFATTDPASGDDVAEAFIGFETEDQGVKVLIADLPADAYTEVVNAFKANPAGTAQ